MLKIYEEHFGSSAYGGKALQKIARNWLPVYAIGDCIF
jgi:hypothetical protein